MDITIQPAKLIGTISAIASKSQAHRLLICAAFADRPTTVICPDTSSDIEATAHCLVALGTEIKKDATGYHITPIVTLPKKAVLSCRDSGSTLRFLLPIVGALGIDTSFTMEGRLANRPLEPLWTEMERHGCKLEWQSSNTLHCCGQLQCGSYHIAGDVSSQFISGLMMAFPLIKGNCTLDITGPVQSKPYIALTRNVLSKFGIDSSFNGSYCSPGIVSVEGDWSNAAFFLGANTIGNRVHILGLDTDSCQGDKDISALLEGLESCTKMDVSDNPDLVPILAVAAAAKNGALFTNIKRLRLKESNRVVSISTMLSCLGISTEVTENTLKVYPGIITGGIVDSFGDHRIAMAAAIAATVSSKPVTILGAECVAKSYPRFWMDYQALGGQYELDLR